MPVPVLGANGEEPRVSPPSAALHLGFRVAGEAGSGYNREGRSLLQLWFLSSSLGHRYHRCLWGQRSCPRRTRLWLSRPLCRIPRLLEPSSWPFFVSLSFAYLALRIPLFMRRKFRDCVGVEVGVSILACVSSPLRALPRGQVEDRLSPARAQS